MEITVVVAAADTAAPEETAVAPEAVAAADTAAPEETPDMVAAAAVADTDVPAETVEAAAAAVAADSLPPAETAGTVQMVQVTGKYQEAAAVARTAGRQAVRAVPALALLSISGRAELHDL